ncbi:MAG: thioredoxin domain-containing protein, partial [Bacteriovoracia bacterium]
LTVHYFAIRFPGEGEFQPFFCNVNEFWSCDSASFSPASNLFTIPISFFGFMVGISFLIALWRRNEIWERTIKFIAFLNALGCVGLGIYSYLYVSGLCPFCVLYYLLSWIALGLLWRYGIDGFFEPSWRVIGILTIPAVLGASILGYHYHKKSHQRLMRAGVILEQYKNFSKLGNPPPKGLFLTLSQEKYEDAPVKVSIFSDFQCPFCKIFAEKFDMLIKKYQDQMAVQYFFYPLDHNCNPLIQDVFHPVACRASYLAYCNKNDFKRVHDEIYHHQKQLNVKWINDFAKQENSFKCLNSQEAKEVVLAHLSTGRRYMVEGTPTLIINGRLVPPGLDLNQFMALIEGLIKENQ